MLHFHDLRDMAERFRNAYMWQVHGRVEGKMVGAADFKRVADLIDTLEPTPNAIGPRQRCATVCESCPSHRLEPWRAHDDFGTRAACASAQNREILSYWSRHKGTPTPAWCPALAAVDTATTQHGTNKTDPESPLSQPQEGG